MVPTRGELAKLPILKHTTFKWNSFTCIVKLYENCLLLDVTHNEEFHVWSTVVESDILNKPDHKVKLDVESLYTMFVDANNDSLNDGYTIILPESHNGGLHPIKLYIEIKNDSYVKIDETKEIVLCYESPNKEDRLERKINSLAFQFTTHINKVNKEDNKSEITKLRNEITNLRNQVDQMVPKQTPTNTNDLFNTLKDLGKEFNDMLDKVKLKHYPIISVVLDNTITDLRRDFNKVLETTAQKQTPPITQSHTSIITSPQTQIKTEYTFYYGESPETCKSRDITQYIIHKYLTQVKNGLVIIVPTTASFLIDHSFKSSIYCSDGKTLARLSNDMEYEFVI